MSSSQLNDDSYWATDHRDQHAESLVLCVYFPSARRNEHATWRDTSIRRGRSTFTAFTCTRSPRAFCCYGEIRRRPHNYKMLPPPSLLVSFRHLPQLQLSTVQTQDSSIPKSIYQLPSACLSRSVSLCLDG